MNQDMTLAMRMYADTARFVTGLEEGEKGMAKFVEKGKEHIERLKSGWESLEGRLASVGIAIGALEVARDSAATDKALNRIGLNAKLSREEVMRLREEMDHMSVTFGTSKTDLLGGLESLANNGFDFNESLNSLNAINKALVDGGGNAANFGQALSEAKAMFHLDLHNEHAPERLLSQLTAAARGHSISRDMLTTIYGNEAFDAASAGLNSNQTIALIEGMGDAGITPEQTQRAMRSLLNTFADRNRMLYSATAAGVSAFDDKGKRRNPLDVLHDINARYQSMGSENNKEMFMEQVFHGEDLRTIKSFRALLDSGRLDDIKKAAVEIGNSGDQFEKDMDTAMDNPIDQARRLKEILENAAESFIGPMTHFMSKGVKKSLDFAQDSLGLSPEQTVGDVAGLSAAALLALGLFRGKFRGKGPGGMPAGFAANLKDLGEGVATGKALSAIGVQPVYVVNMPKGGVGGGGMPDLPPGGGLGQEVAQDAKGGIFAGLASKAGSAAKYLRGAWTMLRSAGGIAEMLELGGAEALGVAGGIVTGTGLAAYGLGRAGVYGLEHFDGYNRFEDKLGGTIGAVLGDKTKQIVAADVDRQHQVDLNIKIDAAGQPRLENVRQTQGTGIVFNPYAGSAGVGP